MKHAIKVNHSKKFCMVQSYISFFAKSNSEILEAYGYTKRPKAYGYTKREIYALAREVISIIKRGEL